MVRMPQNEIARIVEVEWKGNNYRLDHMMKESDIEAVNENKHFLCVLIVTCVIISGILKVQ